MNATELDFDGIWNKAREQAEEEAMLMYPDHEAERRKEAAAALTVKYFRKMYYPQR